MGKAFCRLQGKVGPWLPSCSASGKLQRKQGCPLLCSRVLPGPENTKRTPETERAFTYLGRRGVGEAVGAGAVGAARVGAGTGRCVDSCRSPWSRTSGAHRASPAEMGRCPTEDREATGSRNGPTPPTPSQAGTRDPSPRPRGRKAGVGVA